MASGGSMMIVSSMLEEEFDDIDVVFDHDHDVDVDEEFFRKEESLELSSDSDKEQGCCSLPATPPRRRNFTGMALARQLMGVVKDYGSENEGLKGGLRRSKGCKNLRRRRIIGERWADMEGENSNEKKNGDFMVGYSNYNGSFSGDSEGVSAGVVVITRPKGGKRSLCMDLEEVKACWDLGFELEHELMLEMPTATTGRVSLSSSTLDTASSGSDSPIANWRISSPGDDPRDVKARLKVWAQAVALASSSRHCS